MKYYAALNNYQKGSYAYNCLSNFIYKEEKVDRNHTLIYWNLENDSQKNLLIRALGNASYRLKEVNENK